MSVFLFKYSAYLCRQRFGQRLMILFFHVEHILLARLYDRGSIEIMPAMRLCLSLEVRGKLP